MDKIIKLETLDHDGFDELGPQSNLWDLYYIFIGESEESTVVHHFHREYWFHGPDNEPYKFIEKTTLSKIASANSKVADQVENIIEKWF